MAEAYDQLEWFFIKETLEAFRFHEEVIRILNECIPSVSFSIALNDSHYGNVTPSRGIRRGDPFSPYLSILGEKVNTYIYYEISGNKIAIFSLQNLI